MNPLEHLLRAGRAEPGQALFEDADRSLSAAELMEDAAALAAALRDRGVGRGDRVGIALGRGLDAARAVYGVLGAGACYVPLDPSSPPARLRHIARAAGCRLLLGRGGTPGWAQGLDWLDPAAASTTAPAAPPVAVRPEDIAAILYTSGSTGTPKGVAIPHRAVRAFADWGRDTFGLDSGDRIASLAPLHFDLSLFDLFTGPAAGATTCFVPERLKLAPARLVDWLAGQRITTWYTVPSLLGFLALKGGLAQRDLGALKRILFAGEVFPTARLMTLAEQLPHTRLYNLFGPTETNVCLYWPVQRGRLEAGCAIPVGVPACGAELRIDPASGELQVRGPCLMAGYWRDGAPRPVFDEAGWFATGDRVSRNDRGEYLFHGRLDRMLKSAGYRIEPAEIEQVLNAMPGVSGAVVLGLEDAVSGTRLAAAVAGDGLGQAALRAWAAERLPAWMRPAYYVLLDSLPVLPNGKTDHQRLRRCIEEELAACPTT